MCDAPDNLSTGVERMAAKKRALWWGLGKSAAGRTQMRRSTGVRRLWPAWGQDSGRWGAGGCSTIVDIQTGQLLA